MLRNSAPQSVSREFQIAGGSSPRTTVSALVLAAMLFVAGAFGAVIGDGQRNFDARGELDPQPSFVPLPQQQLAIEALSASIPALAVEHDRSTGATRSLSSRIGYLSEVEPGADARSVAIGFVDRQLEALGLTPQDLSGHEISDEVYSEVTGATHIYLRQTYDGRPVYNGQLQIHVNRDGRVLSVQNGFMPGLAEAVNDGVPLLSISAAAGRAAEHLALDSATVRPIDGRLMWLPIQRGQARLVWNFQVETADGRHYYDLTVDAETGQVWTRFDWVAADSYRVYARPVESPVHTAPLPPSDARTLALDPAIAAASPFGWHDTDGVGGAEFTTTQGNNVHAYTDVDANNLPDSGSSPDCGAGLACDFPIDLTMAPSAFGPAAVANLFYWNNTIHDIQYLYGFDEAAGNFQVDNYGNPGAAGDDVRGEAQDGGGNCNANFFTPSDGSRPRMQMYTCANASPARDGDLDDLVIVHEYGHGISNRLVGGPGNVSCLGNSQQPGEGWSDWLGLVYTHQSGFQAADARGVGAYLFNLTPVEATIRTFPYSTDFGVNPDTYSDIGGRAVPHGVGSVWAEILWEAYWELIGIHGFDPDLANIAAAAGNHRMMLYVNEGMKNTACGPTFLDGRDGIIQAAIDNYGGADVCPLWEAFARRGLGVDASTSGPNSLSATDGFNVPAECATGCGNGICEFGEDCFNCASDCEIVTSGALCGNGVCEAGDGENCLTCAADCAGKQNGKPNARFCCGDGVAGQGAVDCSDSRCVSGGFSCTNIPASPGSFCCGDAFCDTAGENCGNCALDCTLGPEICDSGIDEDCDSAIDCDDGECMSFPACVVTCQPKGAFCAQGNECCSGVCKRNGTCR